jgi:hypothetical protein
MKFRPYWILAGMRGSLPLSGQGEPLDRLEPLID